MKKTLISAIALNICLCANAALAIQSSNKNLTFSEILNTDENYAVVSQYSDNQLHENGIIKTYEKNKSGDWILKFYNFKYNDDTKISDLKSYENKNLKFIELTDTESVEYQNANTQSLINSKVIKTYQKDSNGEYVAKFYKWTRIVDGKEIDGGRFGANIHNTDGLIESVNGVFISVPSLNGNGVIYNSNNNYYSSASQVAEINGGVNGVFINNDGSGNGAAVYNNSLVYMDYITGAFINNYAGNYGAIANETGHIGNISGVFINNNSANGSAIGNNGVIDNIAGIFIGNNGSNGKAIYNNGNGIIGQISGKFIKNQSVGGYGGPGGAIYNAGGTIGDIKADFINNSTNAPGGAIYNSGGTVGNITGDFIGNISSNGGAISNSGGIIGNITGDFINNSSSVGGAIEIYGGTVGDITGDFINNKSSNVGGAVYGDIANMKGNFINNSAAGGPGGAVLGNITNMTGDFINNKSSSNGGAVFGDITNMKGNFIGNTSEYMAGAINGNIEMMNGNFIDNHSSDLGGAIYGNVGRLSGNLIKNSGLIGGAIYSTGNIALLADGNNYLISNNYQKYEDLESSKIYRFDNAITIQFGTILNISALNNGTYTINDNIALRHEWDTENIGKRINYFDAHIAETMDPDDEDYASTKEYYTKYSIEINGDNTGVVYFNNKIYDATNVSVTNSIIGFGKTPDNYTGTETFAGFANDVTDITVQFTMNNSILDLANGFVQSLELPTLYLSGNNKLNLDIDVKTNSADRILVSDLQLNDANDKMQIAFNALNYGLTDTPILFATVNTNDDVFELQKNTIDTYTKIYDLQLSQVANDWFVQIVSEKTNPMAVNDGANSGKVSKQLIRQMTNSMQKRVGELMWRDEQSGKYTDAGKNGFWTRGIYKNAKIADTSVNQMGGEFGYDRKLYTGKSFDVYTGLLGYVSASKSDVDDVKLNSTSYGVGAYGMLTTQNGWFGDLAFREHVVDLDGTDGYNAMTLNMELGKQFVFDMGNNKVSMFMTPSVELTAIKMSDVDVNGVMTIRGDTDVMLGASVIGGPRWKMQNGQLQTYAKFGYTNDASKKSVLSINNEEYKLDDAHNALEYGIGMDWRTVNDTTNVYFELTYSTDSDYNEIGGTLGIRYVF